MGSELTTRIGSEASPNTLQGEQGGREARSHRCAARGHPALRCGRVGGPGGSPGVSEEVDRPWAKGRRECGFAVCGQGARTACTCAVSNAGRPERSGSRTPGSSFKNPNTGRRAARTPGEWAHGRVSGARRPNPPGLPPLAPPSIAWAYLSYAEKSSGNSIGRLHAMHRSRGFRRPHPGGHVSLDHGQISARVVTVRQPQRARSRPALPPGGSSACRCRLPRRRVRTNSYWVITRYLPFTFSAP